MNVQKLATDEEIRGRIQGAMDSIRSREAAISELVKGRRIRITSDWRDQPYGRSKPSLRGKEFVATGVRIDVHCTAIICQGLWCAPGVEDVEFLP